MRVNEEGSMQSSFNTDRVLASPGAVTSPFARALFDQSIALFLGGEPEAARMILHEVVKATVGFELLAELTNRSCANLRSMLSSKGRPGMDNLSSIFRILRDWLHVRVDVQVLDAA
jgi:DNA-binding phage protein